MSQEIQVLVALDREVDRGLIEALVSRGPRLRVLDYLELDGPAASGLGAGEALVVVVADYSEQARDFVVAANRQHPLRPILLVCPSGGGNNNYLGEAFNNGVDDIIALPDDQGGLDPSVSMQLGFAVEKALMRKRGSAAPKPESVRNVVCVLGLKGGSGKTLTSVNLGVALAEAGRSVALMDLDLQFGDLALAMGLTPVRTIYDLVRSGGSLDAGKLEDFLMEHPSGVRALLAPVRPEQAAMITVAFLSEVQRLLAEMFEFVVIDTPPSFSPEVISTIDHSTDALVVAMRDTLALKNTKLGLETLERMEFDRGRLKVLLNRANTNVGIERDDILAILGRDVDIFVPSHRDVARSINQGMPIASQRGSEAATAFHALAQLYIDASEARSRQASPPDPGESPRGHEHEPARAPRQPRQSLFRRARGSA
ncbi:MAG: AAA family ATPase [Solirubrobacterales bacterium]|nr:AAA family ATPase [Solirubrobacterales bacterium]